VAKGTFKDEGKVRMRLRYGKYRIIRWYARSGVENGGEGKGEAINEGTGHNVEVIMLGARFP